MDRWDDDEAFQVARELQSGPAMTASQAPYTTANCGLAGAPMAALDALIETAWSFPGFRCSYGAIEGGRAIRFHTSAGAETQAALDSVRTRKMKRCRSVTEMAWRASSRLNACDAFMTCS